MPFSSGLSPSGAAGRVQMSPRGPRSANGPEDYETESKFYGTMAKLKQGCVRLCAPRSLPTPRRPELRARLQPRDGLPPWCHSRQFHKFDTLG